MKIQKCGKMVGTELDTAKELEILNQYTKKELTQDEVYIFSVILCDNEVDRDFEKFSDKALRDMAELFVGKTGIFDHAWSAFNQTARIYRTELLISGEKNELGEEKKSLKAYAYMLRSEKNAELIEEIEAGIKKEVSVGCQVSKKSCSICGETCCSHIGGENYEGKLCYKTLEEVTDAYEWSFVAVPAQRGAGVTKKFGETSKKLSDFVNTAKGQRFQSEFESLKALANLGLEYKESLREEVLRLSLLSDKKIFGALEKSSKLMDAEELKALKSAFEEGLREKFPAETQLTGVNSTITFDGEEYLV